MKRILRALLACVAAALLFTGTAHAANAHTSLLWFNPNTGELSTWQLNGYGNVLGAQSMDWRCSYASHCSTQWVPVGTADVNNDGNQDVVWFNPGTGVVGSWLTNGGSTVLGEQDLDWRCDYASGCSTQWRPIGLGDVNGDGRTDVLWWNPTSGVVSSWLLNGYGNVLAKQDLDWRCSYASGCANEWRPIGAGDMNRDGRLDLTWFDAKTGVVSTWLLNGYGNVLTKQDLDWRCASSCSTQWQPVGVADVNGDGSQDVTWFNSVTGVVSTWLTDSVGTVVAKQDLDWRCDYASGCSTQWRPVDLVR